jgi:hypothetical protein
MTLRPIYNKSARVHLVTFPKLAKFQDVTLDGSENHCHTLNITSKETKKEFRCFYSSSELYQLSDRLLYVTLMPNLCMEECRVVNATTPHSR